MKKRIKVKELFITDQGIDAIALVEEPAIEVDYLKFSKQEQYKFEITDKDQQILTGPALIPDKLIFRIDEQTKEEFYVFFSSETVKQISQTFLVNNKQRSVNLNHEFPIENVALVESWIIEDPECDKAVSLGYKDLPKGTWMCSMKVLDTEFWNTIKDSNLQGFSIEGSFISSFSSEMDSAQTTVEQIKKILEENGI